MAATDPAGRSLPGWASASVDVGREVLGPVGQHPAGHPAARADHQRDHGEHDQGVDLHAATEQHLGQAQQLTRGLGLLLRGADGVLLVAVDGRRADHRARRRVAPRVVRGVGVPGVDAVAVLAVAARRSLQQVPAAFRATERRGQRLGRGRRGGQFTEVRTARALPGGEGPVHSGRAAERRGNAGSTGGRSSGRGASLGRSAPPSGGWEFGTSFIVVQPARSMVKLALRPLTPENANALSIKPRALVPRKMVCVSDRWSAGSRSPPCGCRSSPPRTAGRRPACRWAPRIRYPG